MVFYELYHLFTTSMEKIICLNLLRENGETTKEFKKEFPIINNFINKMVQKSVEKRYKASKLLQIFAKSSLKQKEQLNKNRIQDFEEKIKYLEEENAHLKMKNVSLEKKNVFLEKKLHLLEKTLTESRTSLKQNLVKYSNRMQLNDLEKTIKGT